jgi:hypothetical protein
LTVVKHPFDERDKRFAFRTVLLLFIYQQISERRDRIGIGAGRAPLPGSVIAAEEKQLKMIKLAAQ